MADQAITELPRVALVYGEATLVGHVREAMSGCVDIAYAASADEFDVARLAEARVTAALVNLDNADWLDDIQARLDAAGVPAVFNDPDISRKLEGWDRARWLRHLTAKLRGSVDFDPPRPDVMMAGVEDQATVEPPTPEPENATDSMAAMPDSATTDQVEPQSVAAVERPLSAHEIHTLTANFTDDPAVVTPPSTEAACLDVDTEALSALIDAQLAAPEAPAAADVSEGWAIAETAPQPAPEPDVEPAPEPAPEPSTAETPDPTMASLTATATTIAGDPGTDLQDAIPALDDWQLLDPDAMAATTGSTPSHESAEPALPDDFADLTLVPMETAMPVMPSTDPIERWLDDTDTKLKTRPERKGDKA